MTSSNEVSWKLPSLRNEVLVAPQISVNVVIHAWERKFVQCSIDARYAMIAMRLETKVTHYIRWESNAEHTIDLQWAQQKQKQGEMTTIPHETAYIVTALCKHFIWLKHANKKKKNTNNVVSTRVKQFFCIGTVKFSNGSCDRFSIVLHLPFFVVDFECALGNANCFVVVCLVLVS